MCFTTKCPKCSVGTLSFDYQPEQAYGLEQEPIAEAFTLDDQSCECEFTPTEIAHIEDEALKEVRDRYADDYDEYDDPYYDEAAVEEYLSHHGHQR